MLQGSVSAAIQIQICYQSWSRETIVYLFLTASASFYLTWPGNIIAVSTAISNFQRPPPPCLVMEPLFANNQQTCVTITDKSLNDHLFFQSHITTPINLTNALAVINLQTTTLVFALNLLQPSSPCLCRFLHQPFQIPATLSHQSIETYCKHRYHELRVLLDTDLLPTYY